MRKIVAAFVFSFMLFTLHGKLLAQAGTAINFQNSNYNSHGDFIYCGQPNFGLTDKLTVAVWIKWTTDPKNWSVANHDEREGQYSVYIAYATHNTLNISSEHGQFWLRNSKTSNKIQFTVENTSGTQTTVSSTTGPNSGTWYFIAGTYDGTTVKLYIDGELEDSDGLTGNIRANTDCRLNMGRLPWGYGFFVGYLDEARVWNAALTQEEIQNQMASKSTIKDADCESYWNFDAGSGTVIADSKGLANGTFYSCLTDVHGPNIDFPNKILDDEDRAFVSHAWDGKAMYTVAGAGIGETNIVVSNIGNVTTLTYGFGGVAPDNRTTPVIDDNANMTWFGIVDNTETTQWVSSGDLTLPVTLSGFSAGNSNAGIELRWITESEFENLGFILERLQKSDLWLTIASYKTHKELEGQGTISNKTKYSFTDENVEPGKEYIYRLSDVSTTGRTTKNSTLSITRDILPETTEMHRAYPNPFNPNTCISYKLAKDTKVNITIFDVTGKHIKTLFSGQQPAGSYNVYWNGTDESEHHLSSGAYFVLMETDNEKQMQKVMLLK